METTNTSLKELLPQYNALKYKFYFFTFLIFLPILVILLFLKITNVTESVKTVIQLVALVFTLAAFSLLTFKNMRKDSKFRKISDLMSEFEYTIKRFRHIFYDFGDKLSVNFSKHDLTQFLHDHNEFKEAFVSCLKLIEEHANHRDDELSDIAKKILKLDIILTEPQKALLLQWAVEADRTVGDFLNYTKYTIQYIEDQIEVLTKILEYWGVSSNMGEAVNTIILQLAGDEKILNKYVDPF